MNGSITVFRSADASAAGDAASIAEMLKSSGIEASLLDDTAVGVPAGAWEVRVPQADAPRAEALIAANPPQDEFADPDESHDLDLETVFRAGDGTTEQPMEAQSIKNLLDSAGIYSVIMGGDVPIPSLGQEVRVAKEYADEARRVISEARLAGPAAAEEAERESESSS